jgi:hypothetical protein
MDTVPLAPASPKVSAVMFGTVESMMAVWLFRTNAVSADPGTTPPAQLVPNAQLVLLVL